MSESSPVRRVGITTLSVVPLFLGVGRHAREDLPVLVQDLRRLYPQVDVSLKPAIGEDPQLISLMAEISLRP